MDNLFIIDVGPETAQWKYLSVRVDKLPLGRVLEGTSGKDEMAIVPPHGERGIPSIIRTSYAATIYFSN